MIKENEELKLEEVAFVRDESVIYELVGEEGYNFLLGYDVLNGKIENYEEIIVNGKKLRPVCDSLTSSGVILLPTEALEYGTVEDLVKEIQVFIHRYVQLTEFGEMISALYVLLSWVYDNFETIPYLRFQGDYGCGKSRAEKVIGSICYKPIFAGGSTTPSPIFRLIQQYRGTLIIDEADWSRSDATAEITKILNCGYSKGTPVLRSEGERTFKPKAYNVFCPKILATRKKFQDVALESRCITERMRPKTRKDIPLHLPRDFEENALQLRNKLLMFRFEHYGQLEYDSSLEINGVEPRVNQVMIPILSLVSDEKKKKKIVEFIKAYNKKLSKYRSDSTQAQILRAVVALRGDEEEDLSFKSIASWVNKKLRDIKHGERPLHPSSIGKINVNDFEFETKRPQNVSHLVWNQQLGKELCRRYGVRLLKDKKVREVSEVNLEQVEEILTGGDSA